MANEIYAALQPLGFESAGNLCFGTWKGYAVSLRPFTNKVFYADVAVRLPKIPGGLRKTLGRALREPGLKLGGVEMVKKNVIVASLSFAKADDPAKRFAEFLDKLTGALREQGVAPADTCAVTGAPQPDSLCLVAVDGVLCYQPVCAAAIRDNETKTREAVEDNRENGSYLLGFIGALIGMLVGVALNVLGIVFTERIYALLFALVPLAAMFGYKLFKGKMSKGSIVIVILLCLLGVLLIPLFEIVVYLMRDSGASLGEALNWATFSMLDPDFLSEISGELLKLLLFMALGVFIAWRYMSSSTNSSMASGAAAQLATLRPNPRYAQDAETERQF